MKRIKRAEVFWVLGLLLVLNVLYGVFLFEKTYGQFEIQFQVESNYPTRAWFVVYPKYKEKRYKTELKDIVNGKNLIHISVDEVHGLQNLGFYWSQSERGSISVVAAKLKVDEITYQIPKLTDFINYSSENLLLETRDDKAIYTSEKRGNGWVMLNLERIEDHCKRKQFAFLPIWVNGIFLFLAFLWREKACLFIEQRISIYKSMLIWEQIRFVVLAVWCFLLAFWNQASHIFLVLSTALMILHYVKNKQAFNPRELYSFAGALLFVVSIVTVNLFYHPQYIAKNSLPYIYLLLVPLGIWGLQKKALEQLLKIFQWGILLYTLLLVLSAVVRYFSFDATISFPSFFFATVENYWHTSYLANLISVAVLLYLYFKEVQFMSFFWAILAGIFMYLSEARLPMLVLLLFLFVFTIQHLFQAHKKLIFGMMIMVGGLLISGIVFSDRIIENQLVKNLVFSKTDKIDARIALWKKSVPIIKEHLWTGIGPQNVRSTLSEKLPEDSKLKLRNYNAHNQYLELALAYGWIPLLLFVIVLVQPLFKSKKLYPYFFIYVVFVMTVESYLARQAGMIFFCFWYSFIIYYEQTE